MQKVYDGRRTDGRTDDGRKVMAKAHPGLWPGELKKDNFNPTFYTCKYMYISHISDIFF